LPENRNDVKSQFVSLGLNYKFRLWYIYKYIL
jgi:hypothetical protein